MSDVKIDPPVTLKAGQIQFIEACHPPLTAGEYEVTVSQSIGESADKKPWHKKPYESKMSFEVDAPRFTLNPSEIHSVYPPTGQSGRFDNALPHVVFTRRTLPWERTRDGKVPKSGKRFDPWIGLLLFREEELQIKVPTTKAVTDEERWSQISDPENKRYETSSLPVFSATVDSLLSPRDSKVLYPDVGQKAGSDAAKKDKWNKDKWRYETVSEGQAAQQDGANRLCLAIDLPAEMFKSVAPRPEDLEYLAHVRQIDTGNKEILGVNDKGWFSLVIGNRLPKANESHRAFLISLEGLQEYLKDDWKPLPGQMLRVAVLGTWGFSCTESNDFKDLLDYVNFDRKGAPGGRENLPDSWLRLPSETYGEDREDPKNIVNAAYSRGYSAFDHMMRQGEKTVSWYRGPLGPLNYSKPTQIEEPVSCSDELLRYDPETGLFDVTYAAAWQLGRLLALQNQSFALALNRTRGMLRAQAERQRRQSELAEQRKLMNLAEGDAVEGGLLQLLARDAKK